MNSQFAAVSKISSWLDIDTGRIFSELSVALLVSVVISEYSRRVVEVRLPVCRRRVTIRADFDRYDLTCELTTSAGDLDASRVARGRRGVRTPPYLGDRFLEALLSS